MPKKLVDLQIDKVAGVDAAANKRKWLIIKRKDEYIDKATWTAAFINNLPDSSFAVIESGGTKDDEGKTKPRSLRHLPYKDASGKVDLPHLRNALARLPQTNLSSGLKAKAMTKLKAAAKSAGVGDYMKKSNTETPRERIISFFKAMFGVEEGAEELTSAIEDMVGDANKEKLKKGSDKLSVLTDEVKKNLDEDTIKKIEELEKSATEVDTLKTEVEELKKAKDKEDEEVDIWKGTHPDVRKRFEEMEGELKKSNKTVDSLNEQLVSKAYVEKAKAYEFYPGKIEDKAEMLRKAFEVSDEHGKKMEETMKAVNEQLKESELLKEKGSGMTSEAGNAYARLEGIAKSIKDKDPKLTDEQAMAKAMDTKDGQEAYAQYEKEMVVN